MGTTLGRMLYTCLLRLLAPAVLLHQAWTALRSGDGARRWHERWGYGDPLPEGGWWLHAVSVGEVQAAAVLVRALRAAYPGQPLLVSTTTATGADRVKALFGDSVEHRYLPFDYPGALARFLARARPRALIILETELWPNLLAACRARQLPVLVASARISARTAGSYRRLRGLFAPLLEEGVTVLAQTAADAERFVALGVPATRCSVGGNLKFDQELTSQQRALGEAFRSEWQAGGQRFVWVAGSTHEGEEPVLLAAHRRLRETAPGALLVMVPRHPARFAQAAANVVASGLPFVRRSEGGPVRADTAVLLGDTLGELVACYLAADAAFVGGSLVPVGGHSLVEPAAAGLPLLSGRQVGNAPEVAAALAAAGALVWVNNASDLQQALAAWAGNPAEARRRGEAAQAMVAHGRGALGRVLRELRALAPGPAQPGSQAH
jgi:3-deoxy-D-manno-octulosonic-acid transferase